MQIRRLENKCSKCMLCVKDCPSNVWRNVDGIPTPMELDLCNLCSHCVAVCPKGAIVHDALDFDQVVRANKKNINPAVYRDIVLTRRSVRHYKERPVPQSVIEQILNVARYSPTASNDQNVGYIVITDRKLLQGTSGSIFGFACRIYNKTQSGPGRLIMKVTGLADNRYIRRMEIIRREKEETARDYILHNAPVLILAHTPRNATLACDNCNIAVTNIMQYAHAMGLGTCFIGFVTIALRFSKKLRVRLGVPKDRKVHASLVMGYPSIAHTNTVSRNKPEVTWI